MKLSRTVLATLAVGALIFTACGGDDSDDSDSSSGSGSATTASEPADDTATTTTAADSAALGDDEATAADLVATLFDSSVVFDDKIELVEGGEAHRADHDAYVVAATAVGGITIQPTAVTIDGDTATVTYGLSFADTTQYEDLSIGVTRSGDGWVVSTDEFCGFVAQAGTPCATA